MHAWTLMFRSVPSLYTWNGELSRSLAWSLFSLVDRRCNRSTQCMTVQADVSPTHRSFVAAPVSSEPPVAVPSLYECAPTPASAPFSTMRYLCA